MNFILRILLILSLALNTWLGYHLFIKKTQKKDIQRFYTSSLDKKKTLNNQAHEDDSNFALPRKIVSNPLVIIIGCIKYNIPGKEDLPGTKAEIVKIKNFFKNKCNYKVVSTYTDGHPETEVQKKRDIERFVNKQIQLLKQPNNPHDGVILIYSGHGENGTIIDSFGNSLGIYKIKNKFDSINLPEMIGIPKIFLFSKCRGPNIIEPIQKNNQLNHPQQDFLEVYANIEDYQVADNPPNGAYMIHEFTDWLTNVPTLSELPLNTILKHMSNSVQARSGHKELVVQKDKTSYNIYLKPNNSSPKTE